MSRSLGTAMAALSLSSSSSTVPRSGIFHYVASKDQYREPHFLDACILCRKPLGQNRDIYMYRGDQPFCTKECRQQQIDMDEAKEKSWRLSSSSTRNPRNSETSSRTVRTSTVVVA